MCKNTMSERGVGWRPISFFIPIAMVGIANFQVDVDDGGSGSAAIWLHSIYRQRHQTDSDTKLDAILPINGAKILFFIFM